jgi:hypothetical protein
VTHSYSVNLKEVIWLCLSNHITANWSHACFFNELSIKWLDLACILSVNDLSFNLWNLSISTDLYLSYFLLHYSWHSSAFITTTNLVLLLLYFQIIQLSITSIPYSHSNSSSSSSTSSKINLISTLKFFYIFQTNFQSKVCFFYLCYLCSRVSVCVLTILYITEIFQVIYLSIIMTNILNQDLAPICDKF